MRKKISVLLSLCILLFSLAGCFAINPVESDAVPPLPIPSTPAVQTNRPNVEQIETTDFVPTKAAVLSARMQALDGMSPTTIERLSGIIKNANLWWEHQYFYNGIFDKLDNPNDLYWNYFDKIGEIQISWAYDANLDMKTICAQEGLTEEEFYEKYGTKVVVENRCDADMFIADLFEIKLNVQNENLKTDLQYIIDETVLAKETHDVNHANNIYKILHDMDYFLLRYGLEDVGMYVEDTSTIGKYYGTLSMYS